jgi:isoleucyl-tRNA synthetase
MWVASSEWTKDVVISNTVVSAAHHTLDKYRLIMKVLLGMLADFKPESGVSYEKMARLDQIAMHHLHGVCTSVRKAYTDLEFHKAAAGIYRWVAMDLSSFYFEAIKDSIYCDRPTSARRLSAQTALHHIFCHLQEMLAPITPLLVEESWEYSSESHKSALEHPLKRIWAPLSQEWSDPTIEEVLPTVMAVNSSVKSAQEVARTNKLMGQSLGSNVTIYLQDDIDVSSIPLETWKEILVVSDVKVLSCSEVGGSTPAESPAASEGQWSYPCDVVSGPGRKIGLAVVKSPHHEKCARCWKYVVEPPEVKAQSDSAKSDDPALCNRCREAVAEYKIDEVKA